MNTPIADFVRAYQQSGTLRLHMPGHKGTGPLGIESGDITEIAGADVLDEAVGIIGESEKNAAALFGAGCTLYSTGGSSQCIKAMLAAAAVSAGGNRRILAARNVHRAFVHACALLDLEPTWLFPAEGEHLCACRVSPEALRQALSGMATRPFAVYVTSPDYLGNMQDIRGLAAVCRSFAVPLLVDNAHGAYTAFLPESRHPLALGAAMCCDSAHKTLPVLTGGAYLHVAKDCTVPDTAPLRALMAVFGSSSPSYLILQSLDLCNRTLSEDYPLRLAACAGAVGELRHALQSAGWHTVGDEPLKLTLDCAAVGYTGCAVADRLRRRRIEPEFADRRFLVLLFTPAIGAEGFAAVRRVLLSLPLRPPSAEKTLPLPPPVRRMSVREAVFSPQELLPAAQAVGRICGSPTVACPPAVPIVVSGEEITPQAVDACAAYGIGTLAVVRAD